MTGRIRIISFLVTSLAAVCVLGVQRLTNMKIRVPEAIRIGDTVTLACDYDLEGVGLYSIRWYHYDEEFYRYVPKESPPSMVFPMDHLNVDVSHSNSKEVTLTDAKRETSGEFKCEVSADAPLFHTQIRSAYLLVADVPAEGPVLRTESSKVAPGGKIRANCTTPGSYPAMNVTWIINDEENLEHHPKYKVRIDISKRRYDALPGLESVLSSISLTAVQDLFKNGKIKLRCVATMFTLYRRIEDAEIHEDAPQLALIMVSTTHRNEGRNHASEYHVHCMLRWTWVATLLVWTSRIF